MESIRGAIISEIIDRVDIPCGWLSYEEWGRVQPRLTSVSNTANSSEWLFVDEPKPDEQSECSFYSIFSWNIRVYLCFRNLYLSSELSFSMYLFCACTSGQAKHQLEPELHKLIAMRNNFPWDVQKWDNKQNLPFLFFIPLNEMSNLIEPLVHENTKSRIREVTWNISS